MSKQISNHINKPINKFIDKPINKKNNDVGVLNSDAKTKAIKTIEQGFTLLELLVSMAIFAMLSVAGWQVFDGLNRAKDRAGYHAKHLSQLQYAYLQIQQDMAQIAPVLETVPAATAPSSNTPAPSINQPSELTSDTVDTNVDSNVDSNANATTAAQASITAPSLFTLDSNQISFVRFADPDPRYQTSPTFIKVVYLFDNNQLIRRQFTSIDANNQANQVGLESVLIDKVTDAQWQAYLPEISNKFPDGAAQNAGMTGMSSASATTTLSEGLAEKPKKNVLPKGVGLSFTYYDMPISWDFAISAPPPIQTVVKSTEPSAI